MKSIRAKLITLLLCCVVLSSTVIGFVCIRQTSSILQNTAKDNMVLLCEKNARALNTVFGNIESSVDTLAHYITENLPSTDVLHNKDTSASKDYFSKINQVGTNHASSLPNVLAVYAVFDPSVYGGTGFFYRTDATGNLLSHPMPTVPVQGRVDEDWWNTPIQTQKAVWISKSKRDDNNMHTFSYVVPIYYENSLLCVVGMDFSYKLLHEMIADIRPKETGFGTVLDRNGHIIAHPTLDKDAIISEQNEEFALIEKQFADSQTSAFETGKYNLDKALSKDLFPYEQENERRMLTLCTLQNGMILCLSAPESEIFSQQTVMANTIFAVIMLISALTLITAVVFASRLSAPIIGLNKAARLFIEGDLDTAVIPSTKDEIGELAESFEKTRVRMKSYIDELYREAHIDGLTGSHNKAAFADEEKALNVHIETGDAAFCVALFDVNYLKITNDTFGHIVGDELLQKVANCMKNTFGPQNVFRIGGDEFAALIHTEDAAEGAERAAQCMAEIEQERLNDYADIPISCAMGVAAFLPESDRSLADVLARADKMMYKHKTEIKKRTPFWQKDLKGMRQVQIERYLELMNMLGESMDAYLFLFDIESNKNWFFNDINKKFAICKDGSPTNTIEEMMEVVHPADREELAADLQKIADGTSRQHNMNYRWVDRTGTPVWINCHGKVINDVNGKPFLLIGRVSDTALRPWYNPLTGLFNKTKLATDFRNHSIVPFQRFVLINIDNLSHINLKHGRKYGDEMLRLLATTLSQNFPNKNIYHLDKDHFALLLNTQDEEKIRSYIDKIRAAVEDSISISVAVVPNEKQYYVDADSIYEYARHLLKSNKSEGGGVTAFFTKEDFAKTLSNIELIEDLENSIYQNDFAGFYLCYQPQVDARTHKVVSAEVLLRYQSKEKGQLFPDVFIPLLERTQMIREVGAWVLETAIKQCVKWREHLPEMGISVNVSPVQLKEASLADTVLTLLTNHGLPTDALTLELTESVELEDSVHMENFSKLRKAGVHISIDDFGTGYANLGYLQKLHANELKIDRLFIKDIKQGSFHHTLINNIADFAKNNGLFVCMEGVETTEELAVLELADPDLLQGYLFDKPLVTSEFEARYITPETPVVWKFEDDLRKQRDRIRFAYFDTKDILSNIRIGLWMLHLDPKTNEGKIYADDTMFKTIGIQETLSPKQTYDVFMQNLPEDDLLRVSGMLDTMRADSRIIQMEFDWMHPSRGKVHMRTTGKCVGEKNGIIMYEGFLRNLDDQYEL